MKKLLVLLLTCSLSFPLWAGTAIRQSSTIEDDGATLRIHIENQTGDISRIFEKSYDISKKNLFQRDFLVLAAFEKAGAEVPVHELKGNVLSWMAYQIVHFVK